MNKYVIKLTIIEVDCIRLPTHESNDALYFITTLTSPGKSTLTPLLVSFTNNLATRTFYAFSDKSKSESAL
ncbi:MAG TPA: hypothetical protein VFZ52_23515, partial [Chryseolinea sp.]